MGKQWYKNMVDGVNKRLLEHQGMKKDDYPLIGRDKKIVPKISPTGGDKPAPPTPKIPASTITMDWLKEQKQKLTQKSEVEKMDREDIDRLDESNRRVKEEYDRFVGRGGRDEIHDPEPPKTIKPKTPVEKANLALAEHFKAEGDEHVARWESKSGKHWVDLHGHKDGSYSYRAPDAGGHLGKLPSKDHAVKQIQSKVDSGYFQPDAAKTPMKRTK